MMLVHARAAHLLGDDADAVAVVAVGRGLHDVLQRLRGAAVGGAEGNDGLAFKVVLLQEGEDRHRGGVPPLSIPANRGSGVSQRGKAQPHDGQQHRCHCCNYFSHISLIDVSRCKITQ